MEREGKKHTVPQQSGLYWSPAGEQHTHSKHHLFQADCASVLETQPGSTGIRRTHLTCITQGKITTVFKYT